MSFYHVLTFSEPRDKEAQVILSNLSEQELLDRFVSHYRSGSDLVVGGDIISMSRLRKVIIVRTDDLEEAVRARINDQSLDEAAAFNRSSDSVVLITAGRGYDAEDILEDGEDVTSDFIGGAPGYAKPAAGASLAGESAAEGRVQRALNHPWIVSIVGGLVVAGLLALVAYAF